MARNVYDACVYDRVCALSRIMIIKYGVRVGALS